MKTQSLTAFILATLVISASPAVIADAQTPDTETPSPETEAASQEISRGEYEAMLEAAEVARMEALEAAEQAREASREANREIGQRRSELTQEQAQQTRQQREELAKQQAVQREEMARMREDLSRKHRELREASREVARAHRELSRSEGYQQRVVRINLGDHAVIGVVLGPQTPEGVKIIGVSPNGPAERAGLLQGDILQSIGGLDLSGQDMASGRETIDEVMNDVSAGDEVAVNVIRDDEVLDFMIRAEQREPRAWQSLIRISDVDEGLHDPDSHQVLIKHIEIDEEAIAAEIAAMEEKVREMEYVFITRDEPGHSHPGDIEIAGDFEINYEEMSRIGEHAMREASVWFGLPHAQGFELSAINPRLGEYFKTERGVLVIEAREDNAYTLQSGDVVLEIGSTRVDTPADMMRALRALDAGEEVEILIKRDRRNVSLKVIVPDNRFSFNTTMSPH